MARTVNPETANRHAEIVRMRTDYPNLSNAEIGERLGVSGSTVSSICSAAGAISSASRRARVPDAERARQSDLCVALGAVMADYHRQFRVNYDAVSLNKGLVNRMLTGLHSFTMLELERIAAWMNTPVSEVLRLAELRLVSLGSIGQVARPSEVGTSAAG